MGTFRGIGREIATGDRADAEVDAFISRRHEQRRKSEPEREVEAAWVAAERREAARRRAENRVGWYGLAHAPRGALRATVGRARGHRGGPDGRRRGVRGRSMRGGGVRRGGTVWDRLGDAGDGPPEGAERATVTVREPEGMNCDTGRWIVRALTRLDASVWVDGGGGPLQVTDRGRWAFAGRTLWARFYEGAELAIYATGPDAEEALRVCAEMAGLDVSERKGFYRARYSATRPAATRRKAYEVCEHPERDAIDAELLEASPRSIRKGYPELSRVALTDHWDTCKTTDERITS